MPTWFFDLTFPLVQQKFSFEKMVDNKQIFSTPDSIGMQLMFEGSLPDTSIGTDILEVALNQNIQFSNIFPIGTFNEIQINNDWKGIDGL